MSIVESDGPPFWSLDASETGESTKCPWVGEMGLKAWGYPYPRVFCSLPSFARIKRPRWRTCRTQRSSSAISRKNRGLWTVYKERERILYTALIPKVILKLFLDIVPSSSGDITRALHGCFHAGYISFRFQAKENLKEKYLDKRLQSNRTNRWSKVQVDARCSSSKKYFKHHLQQRQRQSRFKKKVQTTNLAQEFRFNQFVYSVRNIPETKCGRQRQN